jgi:hypothetical protein
LSVKKDPIVIQEIFTIPGKNPRHIKFFKTSNDDQVPYDKVAELIKKGQVFIIESYEGDPTVLIVDKNNTIKTVKDDTELNNLRGNTNLRETILDE